MKILFQVFPILSWLPGIDRKIVQADAIAGLTVGVMVIPQGMSYAAIAGLPYIYGLYSACVPAIIYAFFGQSRQLAVGPVAMVSLLVQAGLDGQLSEAECPASKLSDGQSQAEACPDQYVPLAFLAAAIVGIMNILGALLRMGFLVSFLGHPVTSGFTSGAAIIIGLSQLKYMLGYDIPKSQYVHMTLYNIFSQIDKVKFMPLILGLVWLAFLMINKQVAKRYKRLKLMGPLGPLISCVVGIALLHAVPALHEDYYVKYVGDIPDGLMPLSITDLKLGDISRVFSTAMSSCLIGYMESIAIGKSLAAKHGYEVDAGQEMLALGVSNLVGSFFSCYPVTGSFSRSAVNNSTGALSQLSGVITGVVVLATLLFLTPLFKMLPLFSLAAIVLNSVFALVAYDEAIKLFRVKKQDFVLWMVAFVGTLLLGVLLGIAMAVGLSLVIVIYQTARPQITILWRIPGTTIYRNMKQEGSGVFIPNVFICRIGSSMYFANAAYVKEMILTYVSDLEDINKTLYIVLEMTPVVTIDSTAVHVLEDLVHDFRKRGIYTAFCQVGNRVEKTMRKAKMKEGIGDYWFFPTVHDAVLGCLKYQHVKRRQMRKDGSDEDMVVPKTEGEGLAQEAEAISVHITEEIGIDNGAHGSCTVVNITLGKDVAMIIGEIVGVFKQHAVRVVRAQMEPLGEDDQSGTRHTYFIKNKGKEGLKLENDQMQRLRDDLEAVIAKGKGCASQGGFALEQQSTAVAKALVEV